MQAIADSRYSFTEQFLRGAAMFAQRAHAIETMTDLSITEELSAEHRAYVVASIVQSAAALESEISEDVMHGPGHHLGSNGIDVAAPDFLCPMSDVIDREQTLRRYELVLHLLRKPPLNRGDSPYQAADLLIRLRNELIHYKSQWRSSMNDKKLFERLEKLGFDKPAFVSPLANFFPHRCLNASLASWTVTTAVAFINDFYGALGIASPLTAHAAHLRVPSPKPCA